MNDITAQAQHEKFESWWEENYHNGNPPRFGWAYWREAGGYKIEDDEPELDGMWNAWQAASVALVEALEKAQKLATQQGNIACALFDEVTSQRQRIAELEEIATDYGMKFQRAQDDLKKMALMESRTVTVKLPAINEYLAEVHDKTLALAFRRLAEGVREGDIAAMRAAGIQVIEGEGQ